MKVDVVHRPNCSTNRAPTARKPEGPGCFGPNPSVSGLSGPPARTAPKPSTLAQTTAGRMVQYDWNRLLNSSDPQNDLAEHVAAFQALQRGVDRAEIDLGVDHRLDDAVGHFLHGVCHILHAAAERAE